MKFIMFLFLLLFINVSYAAVSNFFVTSGTDASNGTIVNFTSGDLTNLNSENNLGMQSNGNWSNEMFNESHYLEFVFSAFLPNGSIVHSVNLTFRYKSSGRLDGTKLEVWNNNLSIWQNETVGLTRNYTYNDVNATQIFNLTYINTTPSVNNFRLRFLAYRNDTTNVKTSHDFIRLTVNYMPPPAVTINYPKAGYNVSGIVLINWTFSGNASVNISYQHNVTWMNVSTNEANDGLHEWNTSGLTDSNNYAIRIVAFNESLMAENTSGTFTIDNAKPGISYAIVSPRKAANNQSINITARAADNYGVKSVSAVIYNSTWNYSAIMSHDSNWRLAFNTENMTGIYGINITASDYANNTATITKELEISQERYEGGYTNDLFDINGASFVNERLSTNTTIRVTISADIGNVSLAIAEYNSAPNLSSINKSHMGKFVEIQFPFSFEWAIINISYNPAELGSLDESSLHLYFYNESVSSWIQASSGVNKRTNFVWANTTHFSTWGIFGDIVQDTSSSSSGSSSSSSGGSACTSGYALFAPAYANATAGSLVNISVTSSNTGTCGIMPQTIKLKAPKGWAAGNATTKYLGAHEVQILNITVSVPSNASGNYTLNASVKIGSRTITALTELAVFKAASPKEGIKVFRNESNASIIGKDEIKPENITINNTNIEKVPVTGFAVLTMDKELMWIINILMLVFIVLAIAWLLALLDEKRFRKRVQTQIARHRARKLEKKKGKLEEEPQAEEKPLRKVRVRVHR